MLNAALIFGSIVVAFGVMPLVYAGSLYGSELKTAFEGKFFEHILLNAVTNGIVMLWALRLTGRLDEKLASVISRALMLHGVLAFFLLTSRQFHSNQVMLTAVIGSAFLGAMVMVVKHQAISAKAALLGDWHPLADQLKVGFDWIQDPLADLRGYDVLLTPSVSGLSPEWATALSRAMLMGKPVRHLAEFVEESQGLVCLDHFDLEHLPPAGLTSYRTGKRLMDLGLVLLALPIALPILALGVIVLVLTMGRPILFIQNRIGLGGKAFRIYKLRSMIVPSVAQQGRATLTGRDPRITPVGHWLRRFRIDELPQLWNVLKGDMSVVGPRPEWDLLSVEYVRELPVYAYRHLVRPGITGWAQVRGGYASDLAETRTKVGYDLFYIKNLSFALDVQILVRTVWTLLSGSGAR
jgi:lipopolysaccharide/colanic/teichoic acid biosynthesis glycosyltransferase